MYHTFEKRYNKIQDTFVNLQSGMQSTLLDPFEEDNTKYASHL